MKRKNKKGWIRVVEAFIAIAFLMGVIFMGVSSGTFKQDKSLLYEEMAYEVLLKMQANETLRSEVISQTNFTIDSNDTDFSNVIGDFLDKHEVLGADCYTKVCSPIGDCDINRELEGDVFTSEILITGSIDTYSPRKVKMFCLSK